MRGKIGTFSEIVRAAAKHRKRGKTIGLITGCFDILHAGHINLFRFAKNHCDIVVVGLENDKTIRINKGKDRPIHSYKLRAFVLSELSSVDYIFMFDEVFKYFTNNSEFIHDPKLKRLRPTYIITNPTCDTHWRIKKIQAEKYGAKLLSLTIKRLGSSSKIADTISAEI